MKKFVMLYLLVTLVVCLFFKERVNAELAYPYDNASYTCSGEGVRASRNSGGYLNKTERDQFSIIYWIGTTPSSIILDFETSFFDGTGDRVNEKIVGSYTHARFFAKFLAKHDESGNVGVSLHIATWFFML